MPNEPASSRNSISRPSTNIFSAALRSIAAKQAIGTPRFDGKVDGLLSAAVIAYAESERIKALTQVDVTNECKAMIGDQVIGHIIRAGQIAPLLRIPLMPRVLP
jgi:hypothetical protein